MSPSPTSSPALALAALPPAAAAALTVAGLNVSFGDHHVLKGFSLTLNRGENVVVMGKSGAGKSVLIKCVIGLLRPDTGTITVLGQNVGALDHDGLDRLRTKVGFLFQNNALYDSMTVRENLLFPLRRQWLTHTPAQENELVKQALEDVGLADTAELLPAALSGGMRKRIALARTLILRPDLILYDEPTTGLDPITAREIDHLIRDVQQKYRTSALIISHDLACVRLTADRVALLAEGRCYAEDTFAGLEKNPDPVVHDFFV